MSDMRVRPWTDIPHSWHNHPCYAGRGRGGVVRLKPLSPQLIAFLTPKVRKRIGWLRISDELLREALEVVAYDRGKPIWWLSKKDFCNFPLPSLRGLSVAGIDHLFRVVGNESFDDAREEILGRRLKIPKPTLDEEKDYFFGLPTGRAFSYWHEVSDEFIKFILETISEYRKKPIWWLSDDDFRVFSFISGRGWSAMGLASVFTNQGKRPFDEGRKEILERLKIPKPTLEEEVRFFSASRRRRFCQIDKMCDEFILFGLILAAIYHKKSVWEVSELDLLTYFPMLENKRLLALILYFRDADGKHFVKGRNRFLRRILGSEAKINSDGQVKIGEGSKFNFVVSKEMFDRVLLRPQ